MLQQPSLFLLLVLFLAFNCSGIPLLRGNNNTSVEWGSIVFESDSKEKAVFQYLFPQNVSQSSIIEIRCTHKSINSVNQQPYIYSSLLFDDGSLLPIWIHLQQITQTWNTECFIIPSYGKNVESIILSLGVYSNGKDSSGKIEFTNVRLDTHPSGFNISFNLHCSSNGEA
jgi:hypothetical protein